MTGRGAGYCAGYNVAGCFNGGGAGGGFGGGRGGRGGGWGRRNRFYATGQTGWQRAGMAVPPVGYVPPVAVDPAEAQAAQLAELKNQAQHLEQALAGIHGQIEALSKDENE